MSTTSMTSPNGSAVPHQLRGSSNLPVDLTPNGNTSVPAALPNHYAVAAVPTSSSRMATDSDQDYQTGMKSMHFDRRGLSMKNFVYIHAYAN